MIKQKLNNKEDWGHSKFNKVKCYNCGELGYYYNECTKINTSWKKHSDSQNMLKKNKTYKKSKKERQN